MQNFNQDFLSRKRGHNLVNNQYRVMGLLRDMYLVTINKYAKFEVNSFDSLQDISMYKKL